MKAGLNNEQAGLFSDAFGEERAMSFSCRKDNGAWEFLWTFYPDDAPSDGEIKAAWQTLSALTGLSPKSFTEYTLTAEDDRNWLAESYLALPPLSIGPFFIYGSHFEGPVPEDQIPLLIEAATAFGSGKHGTTAQCLLAIAHLKESGFVPTRILDMGCGSGILAAAAAKLWADIPVDAGDNDPECVIVTQRHMETNNIVNVTAFESDGYAPSSPVWNHAPYDFVIANILAGPLIDMAQEQSRAVAKGGYLILSGTLKELAADVLGAYMPYGFTLSKEFPEDEWMTLLLQKA